MNFISQMFSKIDFKLFFIVGSTSLFFFILPEYLNNSRLCFSSSSSDFEDRRRVPLKSLPVLPKMRSSSLMTSSHNCFRSLELFSPIRHNSGAAFLSRSSEGHYFRRSLDSELMPLRSSPYSSGASFKYSLISSWSLCSLASWFTQVSSFIF